jgi:hypothetical protein
MKLQIFGPSKQQMSLPFNSERTVNLYTIIDQEGKEPAALYGTPGILEFLDYGSGPQRGGFSSANGRAFGVSGSELYEISSTGTATFRGNLDQSQGNLTFAENGLQMAVCDGTSLYILTYADNVFQKVVTAGLPSAKTVTFVSGYFIVNEVNSGRFHTSALFNGLAWDALDFATAESSPDNLLRVINISGELWLFGERTTEIWATNGSQFFPFSLVQGAVLDAGVSGSFALDAVDNTAIWVGGDSKGSGIIYRGNGFSPQRISDEATEYRLQQATDPSSFKCFSYQEQGHTFFVVTGGGMETAICYDINTNMVHERAYLNEDGVYEQPLAIDHIFAFNKHLVFDRNSSKVYEQSLNYYSDNGEEIPRDRIFTHISEENQRIKFKNLTIGFEVGLGNQNEPGKNPQAVLSLSNDGGKTFGLPRPVSIGMVGQYGLRANWDRLGQARIRTFRVRVTDPVRVAITGAYLNTNG